ncbi:GNAT family N-acetyltransferase [Alkalicoccus urumqiensis]|uniref:GNAT family N-acetyltransferase n=1 Tax=Alkalicoccus urumqiensis TaxID=1548213 RepID=A0A2P6MFK1_ALKUR|nr:GNAT family N-acetyltransferase [Alkalicoccus urumqiensis]PRO65037.1 GNAT family N-acetyltransferase [Alkalicoccus urumqiensis]
MITLRPLEMEDWASVHAYASLPEVCRHQPWGPNTEEDSRRFTEEAVQAGKNRFVFAVLLKQKMIGVCEFKLVSPEDQTGEISYILHPDYWGRNIGSTAAETITDYGFQHHHAWRIQATCAPDNKASSRVLEKNGFQYEGRLREVLQLPDGRRDSLMYSLLRNEWKQQK